MGARFVLVLALAGRSPRARRRARAEGAFFLGFSSSQSMASSSPPAPRRAMRTGVFFFVGADGTGVICFAGAASGVAALAALGGAAGDAALGDGAKVFFLFSKRSSDSSSAGRTTSVSKLISSSKSGLAAGVVDRRSLRGRRAGVGSGARSRRLGLSASRRLRSSRRS